METKTSKKIHKFDESIKVGEKGEKIIKDYISSRPGIIKVVDMAKNKLFYHKDVDLVFQKADGSTHRAEIKTDQYTSGNIYYETVSNDKYNVEGCMEKTECDYLFYYFIQFDKLYILRMKEYKQLMTMLIHMKHPAMKQKFVKNQKEGYISNSIGYTLPLAVLEELMDKTSLKIIENVQEKTYGNK